jgi:hypothetical protein
LHVANCFLGQKQSWNDKNTGDGITAGAFLEYQASSQELAQKKI